MFEHRNIQYSLGSIFVKGAQLADGGASLGVAAVGGYGVRAFRVAAGGS